MHNRTAQRQSQGSVEKNTQPFAQIPHAVCADRRITNADFRVLCAVMRWAWGEDGCWATTEEIANQAGYKHERPAQDAFRRLGKLGYLRFVEDRSKPTGRRIYVNWSAVGGEEILTAGGAEKRAPGVLEIAGRWCEKSRSGGAQNRAPGVLGIAPKEDSSVKTQSKDSSSISACATTTDDDLLFVNGIKTVAEAARASWGEQVAGLVEQHARAIARDCAGRFEDYAAVLRRAVKAKSRPTDFDGLHRYCLAGVRKAEGATHIPDTPIKPQPILPKHVEPRDSILANQPQRYTPTDEFVTASPSEEGGSPIRWSRESIRKAARKAVAEWRREGRSDDELRKELPQQARRHCAGRLSPEDTVRYHEWADEAIESALRGIPPLPKPQPAEAKPVEPQAAASKPDPHQGLSSRLPVGPVVFDRRGPCLFPDLTPRPVDQQAVAHMTRLRVQTAVRYKKSPAEIRVEAKTWIQKGCEGMGLEGDDVATFKRWVTEATEQAILEFQPQAETAVA